MDIVKSFTFFMEDEKWKEKLGIGVGVVLASFVLSPMLIGILGYLIVAGYGIRLLQNVRDGVEKPLPEWDRWSGDLASGFKLFVALFLYALPALIFMVPAMLGAAVASRGGSAEGAGGALIFVSMCLVALYALIVAIMTPGITIAYARDEEISSALRFNTIWEWTRANLGEVIIVTLAYFVISLVIGIAAPLVGTLLCVVGLLITMPLSVLLPILLQNHLYGQLARDKATVEPLPTLRPVREPSPLDLDDIPVDPGQPTTPPQDPA